MVACSWIGPYRLSDGRVAPVELPRTYDSTSCKRGALQDIESSDPVLYSSRRQQGLLQWLTKVYFEKQHAQSIPSSHSESSSLSSSPAITSDGAVDLAPVFKYSASHSRSTWKSKSCMILSLPEGRYGVLFVRYGNTSSLLSLSRKMLPKRSGLGQDHMKRSQYLLRRGVKSAVTCKHSSNVLFGNIWIVDLKLLKHEREII